MEKYFVRPALTTLLAAIFFCTTVYGQQTKIDSLEQLLSKAAPDTNRANLLYQLALTMRYVNANKAMMYGNESLQLSTKLKFEKGIANAHVRLDALTADQFKVKETLEHFNEAESIFKKYSTGWAIQNLGLLNFIRARFFFELGEYSQTVNTLLTSLKYYEALLDTINIARCYGLLAGAHAEMKNFDRAYDYQKKVIKAFSSIPGNEINLTTAWLNTGSLLVRMKHYDEALHYLDSSFVWIKNHSEIGRFVSAYYSNMGNYFEFQERYLEAIPYYQKGIDVARKDNDLYTLTKIMASASNCYTHLHKLYEASAALHEAYRLTGETKSKELRNDVLKYLIDLEEKKGNFKQALAYAAEKTIINDSIYSEQSENKVLTLDAIYQTEKKQREINGLQKDKQMQALELKNKNFLNSALIGSVVVILLVVFLVYRNYRQRQLLHLQRIHELETEKQLLATKSIIKGQEQERGRLAKDLHDGLGGMLSGIKFALANAKENIILNPSDVHLFEHSIEMLDGSIKELRRVAHNLTPESLLKFGLPTAIKDFCEDITNSGALKVIYQVYGLEYKVLDESLSITVYRIIQELVNNVIKHAHATRVIVQLSVQGNNLMLTVEDDGIGMNKDIPKSAGGIGWSNIMSRINYMKGWLDIQSDTGKGTSITIGFTLQLRERSVESKKFYKY